MTESTDQLNNRIDEMEVKITLLEQANEEMSNVIIVQQVSIDKLAQQVEQVKSQMERLGEQIDIDNAPPPHY